MCDDVEYECEDHDACVALAQKLHLILLDDREVVENIKESIASLAEAVCDGYKPK